MTVVDGRVHRLLHGPQQQGVDLQRVGPVLRGLGDGGHLRRSGLVAEVHTHTQGLELVLQGQSLFRRWALVHPIQAGVLRARDVFGRTDVGCQHGFLDQAVGFGASSRNDLFDATVVIANDLRL